MGCIQLGAASATVDLRRFERRDGEVLLRADVLGHRLIDVSQARLVRAADLQLSGPAASGFWTVWTPGGEPGGSPDSPAAGSRRTRRGTGGSSSR